MVSKPGFSALHKREVLCACTDMRPTSPLRCRSFPPDHRLEESNMPINGNKSNRNIEPRHSTRAPSLGGARCATLVNRPTRKNALHEEPPVRHDYSMHAASLPPLRASFPKKASNPPSEQPTSSRIPSLSALSPRLSVLCLPTATYAWSEIVPASQMQTGPYLYMKPVQDSDRLFSTVGYSNRRLATYTTDTKPSSSYGECWMRSENDHHQARHSPVKESSEECSTRPGTSHSEITDDPPTDSSEEPESSTPGTSRSHSESNRTVSGAVRTSKPPSQRWQPYVNAKGKDRCEVQPSNDAWLELAKEIKDPNGVPSRSNYRCLGQKKDGTGQCTYSRGKQSMKRHIEAIHLLIKRHTCSYCPRSFSQKTSLQVHESTHTGIKPLTCPYPCDEVFSDPGKRHRHIVEVHGYKSRVALAAEAQHLDST